MMRIGGSLSYAGLPTIARQKPDISSFTFAWWQCAVGVIVTDWWPLLYELPATANNWAWLTGLGSLHTGLAYALLYSGRNQISTSRFAVMCYVSGNRHRGGLPGLSPYLGQLAAVQYEPDWTGAAIATPVLVGQAVRCHYEGV